MSPPPTAPRPSPPSPPPAPEVIITGVRKPPILTDLYFSFLRMPWRVAIGVTVLTFLAVNAIFALVYMEVGGVANARPGSFADAFYFSVHTMGTIGYGSQYPVSTAANVLVVVEAILGLLFSAIVTGLVFAKFSRFTGRVVFTHHATVHDFDGTPTVGFRIGNDRDNQIVEVTVRVTLTRTEKTREGVTFYRMYDLPLVRERAPVLSRSWTAMHAITKESPLYGMNAADMKRMEAELLVSIVGTDDTSLQLVHARHRYADDAVLWGYRHADVLSERPDGTVVLDVSKFHDVVEAPLGAASETISRSR